MPDIIEPESRFYSPGDMLEWRCPNFPGVSARWRVVSICLGALGQESIIEIASLSHTPGDVPHLSPFPLPLLYVPEPLLRGLTIVETADAV